MQKRHVLGEDMAHNLVSQGIKHWFEGRKVEKPLWLVSCFHRARATSPAQDGQPG